MKSGGNCTMSNAVPPKNEPGQQKHVNCQESITSTYSAARRSSGKGNEIRGIQVHQTLQRAKHPHTDTNSVRPSQKDDKNKH